MAHLLQALIGTAEAGDLGIQLVVFRHFGQRHVGQLKAAGQGGLEQPRARGRGGRLVAVAGEFAMQHQHDATAIGHARHLGIRGTPGISTLRQIERAGG